MQQTHGPDACQGDQIAAGRNWNCTRTPPVPGTPACPFTGRQLTSSTYSACAATASAPACACFSHSCSTGETTGGQQGLRREALPGISRERRPAELREDSLPPIALASMDDPLTLQHLPGAPLHIGTMHDAVYAPAGVRTWNSAYSCGGMSLTRLLTKCFARANCSVSASTVVSALARAARWVSKQVHKYM